MSYQGGKVVREINLPDPIRRIEIVARDNDTFQAFEQVAIANNPSNGWSLHRLSGLYPSAQETEQAVLEPWRAFDFGGMTVNERLSYIGAFAEFDQARENNDKSKLIEILIRVDLKNQANEIVEKLLCGFN